jgi:hypothetical protein
MKYDLVLGVKTEKAWTEFRAPRGVLSDALLKAAEDLLLLVTSNGKSTAARPLDDWHVDDGPVLWWRVPVDEPPYAGTPLDSDWPGYHTHWTPMPAEPAAPGGRLETAASGDGEAFNAAIEEVLAAGREVRR